MEIGKLLMGSWAKKGCLRVGDLVEKIVKLQLIALEEMALATGDSHWEEIVACMG